MKFLSRRRARALPKQGTMSAQMSFADFLASRGDPAPPAGLAPPVRALWHEARGDWEEAQKWSRQFRLLGSGTGDILASLRHNNPDFADRLGRWLALAETYQL